MNRKRNTETDRLLRDARAGGSRTALRAKQAPGGTHGRRKTPRAVEKARAIREHS